MQKVTILYLITLFVLSGYLIIELPSFYSSYKSLNINTEVHYFKSFQWNWFENIFGLLIGYYVQPFIFSLRGELLLPTLKRT